MTADEILVLLSQFSPEFKAEFVLFLRRPLSTISIRRERSRSKSQPARRKEDGSKQQKHSAAGRDESKVDIGLTEYGVKRFQ